MNKREAKKREKRIRAKVLFESGFSVEEIAHVMGVSETKIKAFLKEVEEEGEKK